MHDFLPHRRSLLRTGAALATMPWLAAAQAQQAFPSRPIRLQVGSNPGGPADMLARTFGDSVTAALGQPVLVENKAGASGTIAATQTAKATPDGHTLLVSGPSTVITAPYLFSKLEYDPEKDLVPLTLLGAGAFVVAVHPDVPVKNIAELIALAKAQPGKLSYGSGGPGGNNHVCTETFLERTGTQALHVPYKGEAPAAADLLAGQIQFMFTAPERDHSAPQGRQAAHHRGHQPGARGCVAGHRDRARDCEGVRGTGLDCIVRTVRDPGGRAGPAGAGLGAGPRTGRHPRQARGAGDGAARPPGHARGHGLPWCVPSASG
jgi:hypothetical protein